VNALILTAAAIGAVYLAACGIWPYGACSRCEGDGKRRSPNGRTWRTCPRCSGSGQRLRWGAAFWGSSRRRR
jgi:hypothetical protein